MPGIDLKLLKSDVAKHQALRPPKRGPGGRRLTGAMAVVRENLPALRAMKTGETTWNDIASGLASQGVTQGEDGVPLTGKRLISLIAAIEKQDASRATKQSLREKRQDAPRNPPPSEPLAPRARLASELTRSPRSNEGGPPIGEDEIRRVTYEKQQHLFKKD
jgi:hypothetical protein